MLYDFNFYGVTIPELFRFLAQVGIAIAGAASLWGLVFTKVAEKSEEPEKGGALAIAGLLSRLFILGSFLFIVVYWIEDLLIFANGAMAHEGITIRQIPHELVRAGLEVSMPFMAALMVLVGVVAYLYFRRREQFLGSAKMFFGMGLLLATALMYFGTYTGELLSSEQIFYFFHSWHSVFTVGSVVVVDVLYIGTLRRDDCRRVLYKKFPWISNGIWLGLGLDFLNNMLIYDTHDWSLPVFTYTQIIVAVIVINGTLLSGRINEALIELFNDDGTVGHFSDNWEKLISLSGAISIVSWLTITFSDYFVLTTPWWLYFGAWAGIIALIWLSRKPADAMLAKFANL